MSPSCHCSPCAGRTGLLDCVAREVVLVDIALSGSTTPALEHDADVELAVEVAVGIALSETAQVVTMQLEVALLVIRDVLRYNEHWESSCGHGSCAVDPARANRRADGAARTGRRRTRLGHHVTRTCRIHQRRATAHRSAAAT
eukprot:9472426-Pyramimonas_sp.AAC.1